MINKKLEKYDFVDCLLVDFKVDDLLSMLFVIVEAYYPLLSDGNRRKKDLLKVVFNGIHHLSITKSEEFDFDVQSKYDKTGNDARANEIYSLNILEVKDDFIKGVLDSDMLKFDVVCRKIDIEELS